MKHEIQGVSKKSVILKFIFFGNSNDAIIKEIGSPIIGMIATSFSFCSSLGETNLANGNSSRKTF